MDKVVRKYSNGEITILWRPSLCTRSLTCFAGLKSVFDPRERPWIKIHEASTEKIIEQINKCPGKALSFYYNSEEKHNLQ